MASSNDLSQSARHWPLLMVSIRWYLPRTITDTVLGLYNSFLASGAPSELNIDHSLRNRLDGRMIRTDTDDVSMRQSLEEVVELFELAQATVFKLMASVCTQCLALPPALTRSTGLGTQVHSQPPIYNHLERPRVRCQCDQPRVLASPRQESQSIKHCQGPVIGITTNSPDDYDKSLITLTLHTTLGFDASTGGIHLPPEDQRYVSRWSQTIWPVKKTVSTNMASLRCQVHLSNGDITEAALSPLVLFCIANRRSTTMNMQHIR